LGEFGEIMQSDAMMDAWQKCRKQYDYMPELKISAFEWGLFAQGYRAASQSPCPNCAPIGNREDANSQADRNSTLSRPLRHTGRITMNKDEMIENVARSVAVRARPNHGGTGTCICVDCENIKYGVRWGYREGFDAAQAPLLTALRELVEAVEDGLSFDETDFGEFNHLFKDEIAALTKAKALLPKGE
jgi:hypothetical protein